MPSALLSQFNFYGKAFGLASFQFLFMFFFLLILNNLGEQRKLFPAPYIFYKYLYGQANPFH